MDFLKRHRLAGPDDTAGDVVFGFLVMWTLIALILTVFGIHIGWWDLLGFSLPPVGCDSAKRCV